MMADAVVEGGSGIRACHGGRPRNAMITYFRAAAILLIVAGHSYGVSGIRLDTNLDDTLSVLIKGATALFVFISGFLFDYVYSTRYRYRSFLVDRVKRLLVPYCLLTLLAGMMFSNWSGSGPTVEQLVRVLALGDAFQAYWYIPFILVMFAFAPLHRVFMSLGTPHQVAIIAALAILAGVVQRPLGNDNAFQSVVFYLPIYLSGLFLSLHREVLLRPLRKHGLLLLLVAVLLAVIQAHGGQSDNLQKPFFVLDGFELMGFQKIILSFALVGLFSMLPSPPGHVVRIVADTSFAIFFLHPFVLKSIEGAGLFRLTLFPWIDLVIAVAAIVALCVLIALAMRALLKSNSKYLIGY
jgi:probable poly-beta-1,6-N-acetyl-D-glucosamine export protein